MAKPARRRKSGVPKQGREETDKDPELVAFGDQLRVLRIAAGLTQEGLAHAAGMHWTYVGQIERGERNLTYKNVVKLARGLGLAPADLMPKR